MGGEREDSPDWLRSFQAPIGPFMTFLSGSSGDKSPSKEDSFDDDETISVLRSSSKKRVNRRVKFDDESPVKRRKTEKDLKEVSEDVDIKWEESQESPRMRKRYLGLNPSVWALSSDSDSDTSAGIKVQANEESSVLELSDSIANEDEDEDEDEDEEDAPKATMKRKSPKKMLKQKNVKPTGMKKTIKPLKKEDAAPREKETSEDLPSQELSGSMKGEDSEEKNLIEEEEEINGIEDAASKVVVKAKSPKKPLQVENVDCAVKNIRAEPLKLEGEDGNMDVAKDELPEKNVEPRASSSRLSLVLPEKVSRTKALVECEGESIDLSGDMGAVGRLIIPETSSGEPEMLLDLKGTIYKTTIVPARTFCVVSIGQSEAKIEAIMNDFIQLKAQSNVYDAETMVEGTLEGFSFESEDEGDKTTKDVKGDQNESVEEQTDKKPKGKVDKKSGATQKKGKAAGGKQPKKRKLQPTKKGKSKK